MYLKMVEFYCHDFNNVRKTDFAVLIFFHVFELFIALCLVKSTMYCSVKCVGAVERICPVFSDVIRVWSPKVGSFRCYKRRSKDVEMEEDFETKPFTGGDDERFTEYLKKHWYDINVHKRGFRNFVEECKLLGQETKENFNKFGQQRTESTRGRIDILYKFEKEEDLKGFLVHTDSTFNAGYSSASLKITENETGLFSGRISTEQPKSGNARSGYANITGPKQKLAFFRTKYYDWSMYTHLVFKIRGDGRTYLILLHQPSYFEEFAYCAYACQLYTRGGPYWQIAKLPLQHFWTLYRGRTFYLQSGNLVMHEIEKLGITAAAIDGPFKLEIDYIGLEYKPNQKSESPYERYKGY